MQLSHLYHEYGAALKNPNYQHSRLSYEERQALAQKSFGLLKDSHKSQVLNSWAFYNGYSKLPEQGTPEFKQLYDSALGLRFMAQTNLFFLCKLLEYSKVTDQTYEWFNERTRTWETHNTHEEICNEFFVPKDPANYSTFESFANSYVDLKERLLLVPRGGFKSSINMADCVQWIICYPEVTIAILTGKLDLAKDFVGEVKAHFTLEENFSKTGQQGKYIPRQLKDSLTGELSVSMFQVLFPEHCVKPEDGNMYEFQTPAYKAGDKEPTIRATGIEQSLSGSHFCILKLDDVVTEDNSLSITRMTALNHRISVDKALMHPYGFFDVIGTWYDERDYYGVQIKYEDNLFASQSGEQSTMKIYRRAVWWPTAATLAAGKIESEWTEFDVIMWFPSRLTFRKMREESKKDPEGFAIKYLNDPRQIHKIKFPRELLMRRTLMASIVPQNGMIVTAVDTAYSVQNWADYTVILTALIYGGRFYIINMVRGRFNEYELPAVIAATVFKWKPKRLVIEDSMGVKWMGRELKREMDKLQISVPVQYASLGLGSKSRSKAMKAKPVLRLLGDERLYFINSCEGLEEIYTELEQFTGTVDDKHDDIVSAISLLVEIFAPYADMEAKVNFAESQFVEDAQNFERHQQIYGLGKYSKFNASQLSNDTHPGTAWAVEHQQESASERDYDPLGDVF
jgi:phage terminase large subunit-like protein